MYRHFFKPLLDWWIALVVLIFFSPVILILSLLLFIQNNGRPFFIQPRPGLNGVIFKLIKFKTMNDSRGPDGNLLPDEKRLTRLGKWIRKTSLDELPQFLNVLAGNMSIIGPRPLLPEYLELYDDFQKQRHRVKPGITGWAQVNGRNAVAWKQRFEYDVWYVHNQSFVLDVKIVFLTIAKIVKAEGINSRNAATMEKFSGNHGPK
jgi:lipopolysaccharide/colanic/teichoic acid biosynthesis glycosyltransferase